MTFEVDGETPSSLLRDDPLTIPVSKQIFFYVPTV